MRIPKRYSEFEAHYHKNHAASSRSGKASQFGFTVVSEGEYLANPGFDMNRSVINAIAPAGFDPRQRQDFDPRYTGPNRRRHTPDMPFPQDELRHDDPRFAARNYKRPKPGF